MILLQYWRDFKSLVYNLLVYNVQLHGSVCACFGSDDHCYSI
jgi:hypothetical protein